MIIAATLFYGQTLEDYHSDFVLLLKQALQYEEVKFKAFDLGHPDERFQSAVLPGHSPVLSRQSQSMLPFLEGS